MVSTNTNFLLLQLYVNYQPKNYLLNTVYDEQFPTEPATASLININNCSILITCSQQGKHKVTGFTPIDHDINALKQY